MWIYEDEDGTVDKKLYVLIYSLFWGEYCFTFGQEYRRGYVEEVEVVYLTDI